MRAAKLFVRKNQSRDVREGINNTILIEIGIIRDAFLLSNHNVGADLPATFKPLCECIRKVLIFVIVKLNPISTGETFDGKPLNEIIVESFTSFLII